MNTDTNCPGSSIEIKNCIIGRGMPKICVPIVAHTDADIMEQAEKIMGNEHSDRIDIVEFRADYYEALGDTDRLLYILAETAQTLRDKVLLFTIRSEAEGGSHIEDDLSIYDINRVVIESKIPDLVDVELFSGADRAKSLIEAAHGRGIYIVMSNHDFKTTPEAHEMLNRLRSMQDMGADIIKLAVMPQSEQQLLSLLAVTDMMRKKYAEVPLITISMGATGALSRVTGQIFGSAVTFGSLGKSSAPGQLPVEELYDMQVRLSRMFQIE